MKFNKKNSHKLFRLRDMRKNSVLLQPVLVKTECKRKKKKQIISRHVLSTQRKNSS